MNYEETNEKHRKAYGQIISKAWTDPAFAERLKSDPKSVLAEHGIDVPDGVDVKVTASSANEHHVVIPPRPDELGDEQLDQVAGGGSASTAGSIGTAGCPVSTAGSVGSAGTAG